MCVFWSTQRDRQTDRREEREGWRKRDSPFIFHHICRQLSLHLSHSSSSHLTSSFENSLSSLLFLSPFLHPLPLLINSPPPSPSSHLLLRLNLSSFLFALRSIVKQTKQTQYITQGYYELKTIC